MQEYGLHVVVSKLLVVLKISFLMGLKYIQKIILQCTKRCIPRNIALHFKKLFYFNVYDKNKKMVADEIFETKVI